MMAKRPEAKEMGAAHRGVSGAINLPFLLPAEPRPELTAQTESLSHLPLPGTSCTTGRKPGCFDSGTTSIDQGAPGCYEASDGSCGAPSGLRAV